MLTTLTKLGIASLGLIFSAAGAKIMADLQQIKTIVTEIKTTQLEAFSRAEATQKTTADALATANAKIDELIKTGSDPAVLEEIKVTLEQIVAANKAFQPVA